MKTFEEIYNEYNKDTLAQIFRESKFGYGYNVPEDQKLSISEALAEAKKFREQKYTNKSRLYYHISPLKLKLIKSMSPENAPKMSFFALDPKFCIEFLKYKPQNDVFYLRGEYGKILTYQVIYKDWNMMVLLLTILMNYLRSTHPIKKELHYSKAIKCKLLIMLNVIETIWNIRILRA